MKFKLSIGAGLLALLLACTPTTVEPSLSATPLAGAPIDAPPTAPTATQVGQRKVAPTDPAARALLAAEPPKPSDKEGYQAVTFTELAGYSYEVDDMGRALENAKIPAEISALDNQKVAVSGFIVPMEYQGDKVSTLILVRNQLLCCYGEEPKLNEWVWVNIDPPVESIADVPVTVYGTLHASPDVEEEQVISLYRMLGDEMKVMQ